MPRRVPSQAHTRGGTTYPGSSPPAFTPHPRDFDDSRGMLYDPSPENRGREFEAAGVGPALRRGREPVEFGLEAGGVRFERAGREAGRHHERLAEEAPDARERTRHGERGPTLHPPRPAVPHAER